jgi:hypothetical protein
MESTGIPNQIQASTVTAKLLIAAGKGSWVMPKEDLVEAKGKGKLQMYWIEPKLMGPTAHPTAAWAAFLTMGVTLRFPSWFRNSK